MSIDLRPYRVGDEAAIADLFHETYGRAMSDELWRWRFRDSPAGESIIQLAWDGDVLAGHYAVTQVSLSVEGERGSSGLDVTTMTHPDYRGRGLFRKLAEATYGHSADVGLGMVWGFPNRNSHRGYAQDLGWVDIWEIPTLRWRAPMLTRLGTSSLDIAEVFSFDERFDDLWREVRRDHCVMVERDLQYLKWRYTAKPEAQYRIVVCQDGHNLFGYAVFKRYEDELQVVDLLIQDDVEIGRQLLVEVARIAVSESAGAISLWLNVTHPLHRTLERMGFENGAPVTYFAGLALRPDLVNKGVYDFRNWYITMGDSDVY